MIKERMIGFADEAADSIDKQIEVLNALEWKGIELRTVDKKQIADLTPFELDYVASALRDNGIAVTSLGSNVASWAMSLDRPFSQDQDLVKRTIRAGKALNARFVRIMSYKIITDPSGRIASNQREEERFKRLRWIVEAFKSEGIEPVHENCFTYGGLSVDHTIRLLNEVEGLSLVFDTGNPPLDVDARTPYPYRYQDSYEFYSKVKEHIRHVHIKDGYVENGKEIYRFPGEGRGDVKRIMEDLERSGYTGSYSIEPHMEVVFHDSSVVHSPNERVENFIEYGKRTEAILEAILSS